MFDTIKIQFKHEGLSKILTSFLNKEYKILITKYISRTCCKL